MNSINKDQVPSGIWEEYYGKPTKDHTIIADNSKPTVFTNFFLLSSNFVDLTEGVIDCYQNSIKLLHSLCTYTNIKNSGEGGCIYFYGDSSIVQDRFCAIKCYTRGDGKYSYTDVRSETYKNFVNFGSLYQCGHDYTGEASIKHYFGNKTLISTNNTKTRCIAYAGYYFGYNPVNINFCCFISNDNHESNQVCMDHLHSPDSFVKKSIVKNNSAKIDDSFWSLLLSWSSNVTVSECIFLENKANHAFCVNYGIITVINCTGDNLTASSANWYGKVTTNQMKTDSFNITLSLLSLGECDAENPFSFEPILFVRKKKETLLYEGSYFFKFSLESLYNLTK